MKKYDSYKDSGIDWIGEIPSHWELCRLKDKSNIVLGKMLMSSPPKGKEHLFSKEKYLKSKNIGWLQVLLEEIEEMWFDEREKNLYHLKEGDIVINEGGDIGKVALWKPQDDAYYIQNSVHKVTPYKGDSRFFVYWIYSLSKNNYFDSVVSQVSIAHLTKEKISNSPLIFPPLSEQKEIADYLDEKCGEIDAAVAKVDRELELLDELKQSEISKAVTKGLNPNVSFKPSGIDWIGEIPSHWIASKIKYHISRSAAGVWGNDAKNDGNDIICFRIADFEYDKRCLGFEKLTTRNILPKELEGRLASFGDLLIEKSGGGEVTPVGRVVMFNYFEKATYTNFIHGITLKDNIDNRYMLFYFNMLYSNKINLLFFNQTTGLQNLQVNDYLSQSINLPPLSEQKEIADYLDKKCSEIDSLKEKLKQKKEKLQEFRQSLISEVVTGKRKVK